MARKPSKPHRGRGQSAPPGIHTRTPTTTTEILYGINSVEAALTTARRALHHLYFKSGDANPRLQALLNNAAERHLPTTEATPAELERLCGAPSHQGVALRCGALPTGNGSACLKTEEGSKTLLVALDDVQDPRNVGAVVRNCAVFGADALVIPRHHAAPLGPAASKASAGFLESFPIHLVANLARFLEQARKRGYWVAGTSPEGEQSLESFESIRPLILVLGNEGRGVRPLIRRSCDMQLGIPTAGEGSLNVASASAVFLYAITRDA